MNYKPAIITLVTLTLMSCSTVQEFIGAIDDDATAIPAVKVKPDLDYSEELPDCVTAGERLAENIQVGMTLDEVIRLVGKPRYKLPGSWWWSASFSEKGVPVVKFRIGAGIGTKPITSFLADTEDCSD